MENTAESILLAAQRLSACLPTLGEAGERLLAAGKLMGGEHTMVAGMNDAPRRPPRRLSGLSGDDVVQVDNSKAETGDRHNAGKAQLTLMLEAPDALVGCTRVLEFGLEKYSRGNWKKGLEVVGIMDSMMRHLIAYMNGEDNDPESDLPHCSHILCNALFLSQMQLTRPDLDNRGAKE